MDTQHRLESAYATNVPHPECRGSSTCDPTRKHKSDLDREQCNSASCGSCTGAQPLSTAPAMVEPVCQKCHNCPGTCNPCQPRVDEGVNHDDVPVQMNVDATPIQGDVRPTVAAHRPPDRITRTSSKPLHTTNTAFTVHTSQPSLYGQSLEQQYKKALFYVRHAPQDVELEFREHTGRLQREALFHQIEEGDCEKPQPWAIQVEEREKWDAWKKLHGLSKDQAMLQYLQKVSEIDPYWMNSSAAKSFTPVDEAPRDAMLL